MSSSPPGFLEGAGPMGEIYRSKNWAECVLGAPETWPARLQGYVDMMLRIPTGAIIFWGGDQIQLYNLAYSEIMGPRHPKYLGAPYRECWPDTFEQIYPWMRRVLDLGEVVEVTNALIPVTRYGFNEETYFTFSFVPLRGDDGAIDGFIQYINETTPLVLAERRAETLRALAPRIDSRGDALSDAADAFRANSADLPFVSMWLKGSDGTLDAATMFGISAESAALKALAATVLESGDARVLARGESTSLAAALPDAAQAVVVLPLKRRPGEDASGVVAFGVSARLSFDESYRAFLDSAAREIASNIAFEQENKERVRLNEELRRRAEALTELDRAKTRFFNNVSHEFRTPLTLMLGPLEDMLHDADEPLAPPQRERVELVERNGTRLLKLVNTLLDFSRIEAGRTQARFRPMALGEMTRGLSDSFRSLVERAGLELVVECVEPSERTWVDPDMWEKIVLNLLSNAFKFTFQGCITVRLAATNGVVRLEVSDTGTGIPATELPKLFDRFHRVEGSKGRSFEGSGIGLALVHELVRLHEGEVAVTSEEGKGTTFVVSIPDGTSRAPNGNDDVASERRPVDESKAVSSYVREASSWSLGPSSLDPSALGRSTGDGVTVGERAPARRDPRTDLPATVLLADDNADMREYVRRLLEPRYAVVAVSNGLEALSAIQRSIPDLVLSDVMMPGLDGFGLLRAVKGAERTKYVPFILLSARAGEEARVEGMDAGADDYLVKPFAARELLARVAARLEIARVRIRAMAELERAVEARTAQLKEANQELESFSYSVSHDLRAPLRHILGFAELLERSASGKLDEKSTKYLETISEAAVRGGKLVDDLLAFSRMGRADLRRTSIDLGRMIAELRLELAPDENGRRVTWKVGTLRPLSGDPDLLRLALKNILSNALKYTRPREEAVIEIETSESSAGVEVRVKDNGVGFDMRYVEKLFGVFQRLHSSQEFDGTGIGLALARRVISRHGGTVSAVGEVGVGATITMVLPHAPAGEPTGS